MKDVKYLYITKKEIASNGEISVTGQTADGMLIFGYKELDNVFWTDKAIRYIPPGYIPVFDANLSYLKFYARKS